MNDSFGVIKSNDKIEYLEREISDLYWIKNRLQQILKENNILIPDLKSELFLKRKTKLLDEIDIYKKQLLYHKDDISIGFYRNNHIAWHKNKLLLERTIKHLEDKLRLLELEFNR